MRLSFVILSGCLALAFCGCITKHAGVVDPDLRWQPQVTTQRDVVSKWGNPDRIRENVWTWRDWNLTGGKVKAAYMMIGFTVSNRAASTREHRLTFDGAGRLVKHEVVDSVPGGATWSVWPW